MFESLRSLSDQQVLSRTDDIAIRDRKLTLTLLVHLHELERRKLYLASGYGSMFDYCTAHLKLSGPAAARRLRTSRALARYPELHSLLESGDVNLTTVSMVAKHLTPATTTDILSRIRCKSRRDVERIVAELEPRATLPADRVRIIAVPVSLAASSPATVAGDSEKAPTLLTPSEDRRAVDTQASPSEMVSLATTVRTEKRAVVQFTAREEVMKKLERVRSLASHKLRSNASFEDVIELLADEFIKREDPAARHERREKRAQKIEDSASAESLARPTTRSVRSIPVSVRDQVFVRDKLCTYVSPSGRRCASTHVLQVDHIEPVARGGASTIDNLRLLCAYHNRLEAERLMGRSGPSMIR